LSRSSNTAPYTSRIQKAAAALPETKLLLASWDTAATTKDNLERFERENILGKASPTRAQDMVSRTFRQRYAADPDVLAALIVFAQSRFPNEAFDRILYFATARADPLLYHLVTQLLAERIRSYRQEITVEEVRVWLDRQVSAGKTDGNWSETTTLRVARSLLAALRDFGLLDGKAKKRITPVYLPTLAFAFIAFLLHREQPSGEGLLHNPEWRLFFLPFEAVERFFLEAHQERLLDYHAAGRVIRIDFPAKTPQEYARVLTQRAA